MRTTLTVALSLLMLIGGSTTVRGQAVWHEQQYDNPPYQLNGDQFGNRLEDIWRTSTSG